MTFFHFLFLNVHISEFIPYQSTSNMKISENNYNSSNCFCASVVEWSQLFVLHHCRGNRVAFHVMKLNTDTHTGNVEQYYQSWTRNDAVKFIKVVCVWYDYDTGVKWYIIVFTMIDTRAKLNRFRGWIHKITWA